MDKNIVDFKAKRELFKNPVSTQMDATRAKLEINGRTIKGYPIVWGSKNDYNEVVMKGATLNSLNARGATSSAGNPILVLNQHRQTEPLCRPTILQEDDYGLYFEGEIVEGVGYADDAMKLIERDLLKQLSYGFNYMWDKVEYDAENDSYILKEIKLGEISLVTFSSDENAQLRSYNTMQEDAILNKFSPEAITDLQNLLATRSAAVTNTPPKEEIEVDKSKVTLF